MAEFHAFGVSIARWAVAPLVLTIATGPVTAGPVLQARPDAASVPDVGPARELRLLEAMFRHDRGRNTLEGSRVTLDGIEASVLDHTLLLGEERGAALGDFAMSSHYLDFLLLKEILLTKYYLFGAFEEKRTPIFGTSAAVGPLALVIRVGTGSGNARVDDQPTAERVSRSVDLGQFRVLWFVSLLVPTALALMGLGSKARWLSSALNCWVLAILGLVVLIWLYAQGAGAIWYTMAELMVPLFLSAGLGCCVAGVLARQE